MLSEAQQKCHQNEQKIEDSAESDLCRKLIIDYPSVGSVYSDLIGTLTKNKSLILESKTICQKKRTKILAS